jgi:hypothetical protein
MYDLVIRNRDAQKLAHAPYADAGLVGGSCVAYAALGPARGVTRSSSFARIAFRRAFARSARC